MGYDGTEQGLQSTRTEAYGPGGKRAMSSAIGESLPGAWETLAVDLRVDRDRIGRGIVGEREIGYSSILAWFGCLRNDG
jgi:hypothetical protein